jgi:hypothetical protein
VLLRELALQRLQQLGAAAVHHAALVGLRLKARQAPARAV